MSPELYQVHAFLEKYKTKNVPQIIEACFAKLRALEMSSAPDNNLAENLKAIVLLLKHLRRPGEMSPEVVEYLRQFLSEVVQRDRRAKHALEVLTKK
ncbi:MAG: hypothetical protein K6T66_10855 [Peptococcaceae bacterium]|nr:hypothetical protein [Peptococcaceae bacterium]